jgi:hypothetical protein
MFIGRGGPPWPPSGTANLPFGRHVSLRLVIGYFLESGFWCLVIRVGGLLSPFLFLIFYFPPYSPN